MIYRLKSGEILLIKILQPFILIVRYIGAWLGCFWINCRLNDLIQVEKYKGRSGEHMAGGWSLRWWYPYSFRRQGASTSYCSIKRGEMEGNAGSLGGYWVDECSVNNTCIEHVPCVKQWGHNSEHVRYGCCSQGKYSLVGEGNNKTNKRTTNLSWSQCHFNVVETEPESDHVAAFQISQLHSLCQVILFPCIYSFIQSSIRYLTNVCPELLFCFLFCATGGSPID